MVTRISNNTSVLDLPGTCDKATVTDVLSTKACVTWNRPASDGGTAILGYILECKSVQSQDWQKCNPERIEDTTYTVTHLNANTAYTFRVAALNKVGSGSFGEESDEVITLGKRKAENKDENYMFNLNILLCFFIFTLYDLAFMLNCCKIS